MAKRDFSPIHPGEILLTEFLEPWALLNIGWPKILA